MYSHEIDSYLRNRNWELNPIEYMNIINVKASPELDHITYNHKDNDYKVWTKNGYEWTIKVIAS